MRSAGVIAAFILDGNGGGRELNWDEIESWQPEQGVLWVHLDCNHAAAREWLEERSGIDSVAAGALLSGETRPRLSHLEQSSLIFLRGVNLAEGADPEDMVSIRILVDEHRVISTRRRRLLSVRDIVESLRRGNGPCNSSEFVVQLVDHLTMRMDAVIDELEDRTAQLEEAVMDDGQLSALRSELNEIRRQTIKLRRYLAPQREALLKMAVDRKPWLSADDRSLLQESTDRLIRYIEELDTIRERAVVTQEELMSRVSDQINQRMYVLSLIAALFLPLGFFTGLLGVNIGGIPGTNWHWAFALFVLILVLIAIGQLSYFKLKKWI